MNADGSGLQPLFNIVGSNRAARAGGSFASEAAGAGRHPPRAGERAAAKAAGGPYDIDGTFVFDALNVYFNAAVDTDIVSAPPIGSGGDAAVLHRSARGRAPDRFRTATGRSC